MYMYIYIYIYMCIYIPPPPQVSLKAELETGYAKRGARQGQAIREAQTKVSGLEHSLTVVGGGGGG